MHGPAHATGASRIATALQDAGYYTILVGKYLNGYANGLPPGWNEWLAFSGDAGYYGWDSINKAGTKKHYGSKPAHYSTDVLAMKVETLLDRAPDNKPVFLLVCTFAPHGEQGNPKPALRHANAGCPAEGVAAALVERHT